MRLALQGEIDMCREPELRALADTFDRSTVPSAHVDLSEVEFLDSVGLAFLARLLRTSSARGGRVTLGAPSSAVRRVLAVSGMLSLLEVVD
jgi:anti-sigma B factor antagonist